MEGSNNTISDCRIWWATGMGVYESGSWNCYYDNEFSGISEAGMQIFGEHDILRGNKISDCSWKMIVSEGDDCLIENNWFMYNGAVPCDISGVGTVARWNTGGGYKTEASGSLTNTTATTFVITHGLVATPVLFFSSFNSTEIDAWSWVATSTTITITVANSAVANQIRTAYWYAQTWNYP